MNSLLVRKASYLYFSFRLSWYHYYYYSYKCLKADKASGEFSVIKFFQRLGVISLKPISCLLRMGWFWLGYIPYLYIPMLSSSSGLEIQYFLSTLVANQGWRTLSAIIFNPWRKDGYILYSVNVTSASGIQTQLANFSFKATNYYTIYTS